MTFTVEQAGDYSFGFMGLNVPTNCACATQGCGDGGWDKRGFLAGVSLVKVDSPLAETTIPEDLKVKVAAPAPTKEPQPVPKTGDPSDLLLWGGLVILGILGMAALTAGRRRKE